MFINPFCGESLVMDLAVIEADDGFIRIWLAMEGDHFCAGWEVWLHE